MNADIPTGDDKEFAIRAARLRLAQDLADYGHELAGLDVGRITRFFTNAASRLAQVRKEQEAERLWRTLAELMRNPIYRARYETFGGFLNETRSWAEETAAKLQTALDDINRTLNEMLASAPRLPGGGPRVFRFADGRVIDEHGAAVSPEIAAGVIWPKDAPGAEAYIAALERRDGLERGKDDLTAFQIEFLGPAQNRHDDAEQGVTIGEMDQLEAEIRSEVQRIETGLAASAPDIFVSAPPSDATLDAIDPVGPGLIDKPSF